MEMHYFVQLNHKRLLDGQIALSLVILSSCLPPFPTKTPSFDVLVVFLVHNFLSLFTVPLSAELQADVGLLASSDTSLASAPLATREYLRQTDMTDDRERTLNIRGGHWHCGNQLQLLTRDQRNKDYSGHKGRDSTVIWQAKARNRGQHILPDLLQQCSLHGTATINQDNYRAVRAP